jgi:hypothetical protein
MMKEKQTLANMTAWLHEVFTVNFAQQTLRQGRSLTSQQLPSIRVILQYNQA